MYPLYLLLLVLFSLPVSSQHSTVYEGGEVSAIKWTGKQMSTKVSAGFNGKVIYNHVTDSYTVTWARKDGTEPVMKFTYIGKLDDLLLYREDAGKQYAIDNRSLTKEGVFLALQVDLTTNTIGNKGLLLTKLKRK